MGGWWARGNHSTGWSPVYLNQTRYWWWLCGIVLGKCLFIKIKKNDVQLSTKLWTFMRARLLIALMKFYHLASASLPSFVRLAQKTGNQTNQCINKLLQSHKSLNTSKYYQSRISRTPYPNRGGYAVTGVQNSVPSPLSSPKKVPTPLIQIWSTRNQ